ncbi:MAG: L,D-transpeptidase family protein [Pseudomonadota bacterium]
MRGPFKLIGGWVALAVCLSASITSAGASGVTASAIEQPPLPVLSPNAAEKRAALIRSFGTPALGYLESLKGKARFKAPSELDPRFTMALYVNTAARGPHAQRMWMMQREAIGGAWSLAMWDKGYWRRRGLPGAMTPPYSWLVSTGRHYRGDRKSGPTPTGVYTIDERKYRMAYGYTVPGMINVTYIDLHYSSGRRSGVAFHGTTRSKYRKLGRIDSHGCIRMTQPNARALLDRLRGRDGVLSEAMRWGEVPRFWKRERGGTRYGYHRDGATHPLPIVAKAVSGVTQLASVEPTSASAPLSLTSSDAGETGESERFPSVLTKQGYRAVVVLFQD